MDGSLMLQLGGSCPKCASSSVIRDGGDDMQPHRPRYRCKACASRFDDLTGTVLAGHHQPLRVWVLCLSFMGLNLLNRQIAGQIAGELGLTVSDVQVMTEQLRHCLVAKAPAVQLQGKVEPDARASSGIDEVYVVAGHKGQPPAVAKRDLLNAAANWQARRAAARWRRTRRRSTSVFSISCIMRADVAKPSLAVSLRPWSHDAATTPEPHKSHPSLNHTPGPMRSMGAARGRQRG